MTLADAGTDQVVIDEDTSGPVAVSATTNAGSHLTQIVISGFESHVDASWLDLTALPGAVFDAVAGTLTLSGLSGTSYTGSFTVTPPADSDQDAGSLTATATAVNDVDPSITATDSDSADVVTDAVADAPTVTVSVVDSGDADSSFQIAEDGSVTVGATFGDHPDSSEVHTVVVDIPDGFSVTGGTGVYDAVAQTVTYTVTGGSLNDTFTVTNDTAADGTSTFNATATATETNFSGTEPDLTDNVSVHRMMY